MLFIDLLTDSRPDRLAPLQQERDEMAAQETSGSRAKDRHGPPSLLHVVDQ